MGMTQGLLAAMVAKAAPADLRGTAFGIMYLGAGVAMLLASLCAGYLWQRFGPPWTFAAGACFAMLAMVLIATVRGTPRPGPETEAWLDAGGGGA